jgi:hypothetical protein
MARFKMLVGAAVAASTVLAVPAPSAYAQVPRFEQEVTVTGVRPGAASDYYLTFTGPFAIPGVSLTRGTYLFRRVASSTIQILSANRQHVYAMVLTMPTTRMTGVDQQQIVFGTPLVPGAPRPIKAWFLPGETSGQQFLYAKWQTSNGRTD